MQQTMTNFGKRLLLEQRIKDNSTVPVSSNLTSEAGNRTTQGSSAVRKSKTVDQFLQDDQYEPVRPTINNNLPQGHQLAEMSEDDSMLLGSGVSHGAKSSNVNGHVYFNQSSLPSNMLTHDSEHKVMDNSSSSGFAKNQYNRQRNNTTERVSTRGSQGGNSVGRPSLLQ